MLVESNSDSTFTLERVHFQYVPSAFKSVPVYIVYKRLGYIAVINISCVVQISNMLNQILYLNFNHAYFL